MKPKDFPKLTIPTPCSENWGEMAGDARSRFCAQCQHAVHDLSAMSPKEAHRLLTESGGRLCVRMTVDAEGRVVFPGYEARLRAGRLASSRAALAGLAAGSALALASCQEGRAEREVMLGLPLPPASVQGPMRSGEGDGASVELEQILLPPKTVERPARPGVDGAPEKPKDELPEGEPAEAVDLPREREANQVENMAESGRNRHMIGRVAVPPREGEASPVPPAKGEPQEQPQPEPPQGPPVIMGMLPLPPQRG